MKPNDMPSAQVYKPVSRVDRDILEMRDVEGQTLTYRECFVTTRSAVGFKGPSQEV